MTILKVWIEMDDDGKYKVAFLEELCNNLCASTYITSRPTSKVTHLQREKTGCYLGNEITSRYMLYSSSFTWKLSSTLEL